jgi:anthranilate/para-aminobenzoate synthase component II
VIYYLQKGGKMNFERAHNRWLDPHIGEEASIAARELEKVSAMKRKARRIYGLDFEPERYAGQGRLL